MNTPEQFLELAGKVTQSIEKYDNRMSNLGTEREDMGLAEFEYHQAIPRHFVVKLIKDWKRMRSSLKEIGDVNLPNPVGEAREVIEQSDKEWSE